MNLIVQDKSLSITQTIDRPQLCGDLRAQKLWSVDGVTIRPVVVVYLLSLYNYIISMKTDDRSFRANCSGS